MTLGANVIEIFREYNYLKGVGRTRNLVLLFRVCNLLLGKRILILPFILLRKVYSIYSQFCCIDLPVGTKIGFGVKLFHGCGIVINKNVAIGNNVELRPGTVIGDAKPKIGFPIIGNNVSIGANSTIIGPVNIGNNCIIGAGSVVTKDVIEGDVVVGNPAKSIKNRK